MLLVSVAAALWAFDAYFRPGLTKQLSSGQIVLVEDLMISICLLPVLVNDLRTLRLPTVTLDALTSRAREKSMRTSALWPLTRFARLERTVIDACGVLAAAAGTALAESTASVATTSLRPCCVIEASECRSAA